MVRNHHATCAQSNALTIRKGRLHDLSAVISLERAAFGRQALDPSTLFWLLLRRWSGFIVAEITGNIVGYAITRVSYWPRWAKVGGITSIAIHPEHYRKGFGRQLMLAAIEFLTNTGVKRIELEVNIKNEPAKALYHNLGFILDRNLPNYYGPGEDGIRMVLQAKREEH